MAQDPVLLSPFVSRLIDEARAKLLDAAGIEPERVKAFSLKQREKNPSEWLAEITIADPAGDFILDLFGKDSARDAWFRTAHFACAYRPTTQHDPFAAPSSATWLKAHRERLTKRDQPGAPVEARLQDALETLGRFLPFARLGDASFRLAMPSESGGTGILWLGFGCNQDCSACWQGRRWPAPPPSVFEGWLDEMIAAGMSCIILSGGEPTLVPFLPELIRRARQAERHVVLETNGLQLRDAEYRRSLISAGLSEVVISLHAADASVSDVLTRTPGTHALTLEAIDACLDDGIGVGIHCVVDRRNAAGLEDHARLIVDRFVTQRSGTAALDKPGLRRVSYSFPTRYFDEELYRQSLVNLDDVRAPLSSAIRRLRAARVEVNFLGMSGFALCAFDEARTEFSSLGEVRPGESESAGRSYEAPCRQCEARSRCLGIQTAYVEVHGDRGLRALKI